jgi:hypothetical protein
MVTDEALHLAPLPSEEALRQAPARVARHLNGLLAAPREAKLQPWKESHWSGALNFAYEHYQCGYDARRRKLTCWTAAVNRERLIRRSLSTPLVPKSRSA